MEVHNKIIMITDQSDPTGCGLFSKCARNHASRLKPKYRPSTAPRQPKLQTPEQTKKKSRTHFGFDKQVSREQRQKTFRHDQAPPVGQYNPVVKSNSKLVWDILKAYTSSKRTPVALLKPASQSAKQRDTEHITSDLSGKNADMSLAEEVEQNATTVPKSATPSTKQSNHRSQCMVDMSRMTGRREKTNESPDWGKVDVMHSLQYIKGSISKNINFGKTKREKVKRVVMNNRSYDYDLSKVRPKRRGLVEFGATRGRDQHLQPDKNYSYQHYEYDSYVWQSNSSVFPNTKTHGVDFNKQTSRYKLENQHS